MKDLPIFLRVEDVLAFHSDQIREFGGSEGLRDKGGLDSAVAQAQATFDDEYLHNCESFWICHAQCSFQPAFHKAVAADARLRRPPLSGKALIWDDPATPS